MFHGVHTVNFNARINSQNAEQFERSEKNQAESNAPSYQHQNADQLPSKRLR